VARAIGGVDLIIGSSFVCAENLRKALIGTIQEIGSYDGLRVIPDLLHLAFPQLAHLLSRPR